RTFASVRLAAEFKGTHFVTIPDTSLATICPACDGRDLLGGSVTLAVTHVVSAPLAVSHQDGFSWSAFYRRREELGGTRWSSEARSRVGLYAHIPGLGGFAHHVLAVRLSGRSMGGRAGAAPHAAPLRGRGARRRLHHQLRLPAAGPARRRGAARRSALWGGPPPARVYGARFGLLSRGTGGSPVGASAGRTRRWVVGYNSTMRRSLVLLALLVGPATRLPAQSPAERAAIEALRDSLTAVTDSLALKRFEAATIQVAKQQRNYPLIHCRL